MQLNAIPTVKFNFPIKREKNGHCSEMTVPLSSSYRYTRSKHTVLIWSNCPHKMPPCEKRCYQMKLNGHKRIKSVQMLWRTQQETLCYMFLNIIFQFSKTIQVLLTNFYIGVKFSIPFLKVHFNCVVLALESRWKIIHNSKNHNIEHKLIHTE